MLGISAAQKHKNLDLGVRFYIKPLLRYSEKLWAAKIRIYLMKFWHCHILVSNTVVCNVKSRISEKGKPQFDTALIQCIKRGSKKIKCRSRAQWDQNLYELAFEFLLQFQIFNRFLFHFSFHTRFKLYIFCVWNLRSI